ncbi:endolytic transglycosylase MltG [Marisediminicola senii]|uniref:endolytic transglycosylase MltG n=1 Tax=Marisediminicola senii TaxID=2711233 RepID=UPI001F2DE830|nr:endolytic transglycosylase MltG [Marisediminicola senii]
MAKEPSWDEIFTSGPTSSDPQSAADSVGPDGVSAGPHGEPASRPVGFSREQAAPAEHRPASERTRRKRGSRDPEEKGMSVRRHLLGLLAILVTAVLVLGAGAAAVFFSFEDQIRGVMGWEESNDFDGEGSGEVVVTITNGQVGSDVATTLVDAGVVKSYEAFYGLLLENPAVAFQPGSFALRSEMSAQAALDALTDPANKVSTRVAIPEGTTLPGVLERLASVSDSTGVTREQLDAASTDLAGFGLPAEAPSLEGYLFPATYSLDPGLDAKAMLQMMVTEMFTRLDALGVPAEDRHRVLTLAALTQKEGGNSNDFFKIARVWENRIAEGMPLQSDATVSYGSGGTTISTSDEERADASNPYNTYANPGLPVGPISNPGEDAIEATLNPAEGSWMYFVLINGETGETAFTDTFADHQEQVLVWQQWLREHPGFDDPS